GHVRDARVEQMFDRGITARQRVADDHEIRRACRGGVTEMLRAITGMQGDAEPFELGAHRRIHILVGARNLVTQLARERRDAAHEGSADAEDVDAHQFLTRTSPRLRAFRRRPASNAFGNGPTRRAELAPLISDPENPRLHASTTPAEQARLYQSPEAAMQGRPWVEAIEWRRNLAVNQGQADRPPLVTPPRPGPAAAPRGSARTPRRAGRRRRRP